MIRSILALDAALPVFPALDVAMRQGALLLAGAQLDQIASVPAGAADPAIVLRRAALDYLANRYAPALTWLAALANHASDRAYLRGCAHFLQALIAIDQRQETAAQTELQAAQTLWRHHPQALLFCRLADALLQHYLSRFDQTERTLSTLSSDFERADQAWGYWQVRRITGLVQYERTNYQPAVELLTEARAAYAAIGDLYETARCDKAIASAYRRLDNQTDALAHIQSAITYFDSQQLIIPQARCLTTLGGIQFYFNTQEQALLSFAAAAHRLEDSGLQLELAHAIANIGLCYYWLGHNRLALQAYTRATELATAVDSADAQAQFTRYMANIFWNDGQSEEALQSIRTAANLWRGLGAMTQAAGCWRIEAEYLLEREDFVQAERLLAQSSQTFLLHGRPTQAALASIPLARLRIEQGDVHTAIALLQTCDEILRRHQRAHQAAAADILLGQLYLQSENAARASAWFHLALDSAPPARIAEAWRAHQGLATIAAVSQNWPQAAEHLQQAIVHLSRLRRGRLSARAAAIIARESLPVYERAIELALGQTQPERALAVLEDQKALQVSQQLKQGSLDKTDAAMPQPSAPTQTARADADRLDELRAAIRRAHELEDWRSVEMLERRYQHLAEKITASNAPYASLFKPPTLDLPQLRARLDERHGAGRWGCLSYGWLGDAPSQLYRFWLDSDNPLSSPQPLTTLDRHLLSLACRPEPSYRRRMLAWNAISQTEERDLPREWERVQDLMLPGAWQEHIHVVDALYVFPSGPLASFPFAALASGGAFLGLTKELSQAPSLPFLQTLLQAERSPHARRWRPLTDMAGLVFAVSAYPNPAEHSPLPATNREALSLGRRLSPASQLFTGADAGIDSLETLRSDGTLADFELLHFAAHSLLHPHHAHLCQIALHDGSLYIVDILEMRLNARLVTLAACDTATGHMYAGDEQMGLPQAFLMAGADTLLASLWPVEDDLAAAFLEAFYEALAPGGISPARALAQARQSFALHHHSPYTWGAFTLLGLA